MSGVTAIGYENQFKTGLLEANSAETDLAASNLSSDLCSPATGWQTANGIIQYSVDGMALLKCTFAQGGINIRAVALTRTNLTPYAQVTVQCWTSGSPPNLVEQQVVPGPAVGYGQIVVVFDDDVTCDFVQILFDDPTNTDNYINVGGAFAGRMWLPRTGASWDTTYGRTVTRSEQRTRGGQRVITPLYSERYWNIVLDNIGEDEAFDEAQEMERIASLGVNVLFIPNYSSIDIAREAVFGVLEQPGDTGWSAHIWDARKATYRVTERL